MKTEKYTERRKKISAENITKKTKWCNVQRLILRYKTKETHKPARSLRIIQQQKLLKKI